MATFGDLDRYFDPGLVLTVKGKEYTVPLPSAELGLWCRRAAQAAGEVHAASTEEEMQAAVEAMETLPALPGENLTLQERVLGTAYQQMVDDKVEDPYIQFCGSTAYLWIIAGEETAAKYWTSGGRPEAWGPANRQERRAAKTSTGGANGAPSPASTSGTSTRQRSGNSGRARQSRGRRS